MDDSLPTSRLTAREKEALRAWLDHKSAKEIAIDLGITHHAVEKRLKMARTKLGAATTLQAARTLAAAEGYGQTVTAPPDLAATPRPRSSRRYQTVLLGGIAMSLAIVFALALALPGDPASEATPPPAQPSSIKLDTNMAPIFDHLDANRSGYLEAPEAPFVDMAIIDPARPGDDRSTAVLGDKTDPGQVARFYAEADTDGDKRVSFREFHVWNSAELNRLGIDTAIPLKVTPLPQS